jgi:hypothetical protein
MTGPATFSEAWDMPFTHVLNRYQVLENRDTMCRAIATLRMRGEWNDDRSLDPDDYPPLTTAEHLEMLALGEVIARHYRRRWPCWLVRSAVIPKSSSSSRIRWPTVSASPSSSAI